MSRTAVITGAYGYLGSRIRAGLDAAGWSTVALVRAPRAGDRAAAWALGELPDPALLAEADALVHCAYDFGPRTPGEIWRANVAATAVLLRCAHDAGIGRSLVLSSMSAYEGTTQLYGRAKLAIEELTLNAGGIAVRPGLVYGDAAGGMAGTLRKLTRLPVVPVFGGRARQFPVHEDDLVRAIVEILDTETWRPEVIAVAQPRAVSFRQLLSALAGRRPRFLPMPWQGIYGALKVAETLPVALPLRSDSVLGLVRPAPSVPRSQAFPDLLESLRVLEVS